MVHICSSSQLINEFSPFVASIVYITSAFFYEFLDSDFLFYVFSSVDTEMFFHRLFYGQSVTIPSSISVYSISFHRFVSQNRVLHGRSHSVSEMWRS